MIKQLVKRFLKWIKYLFYDLPVGDPKKVHATEVLDEWVIVVYHKQKINLRKSELPKFAAMSRGDKRAMAEKFKSMEKKGLIRFEIINGKTICIRNVDYEAKIKK